MANWKQTLDITDLMEDFYETEDVDTFAKRASTRIQLFIEHHHSWTDRTGITEDLEEIAEGLISYSDDKSEVDFLLDNLYDLADNARIWVKTF